MAVFSAFRDFVPLSMLYLCIVNQKHPALSLHREYFVLSDVVAGEYKDAWACETGQLLTRSHLVSVQGSCRPVIDLGKL